MKTEVLLLICIALLTACAPPEPDQPPDPPDPIGDQLLRTTTAIGFPACSVGHLYRNREQVQYQCFDKDGVLRYENRGTLSDQGQADLDAALAAADPTNTTPTNIDGFCTAPDSDISWITLWVGSHSVDYPVGCPPEGLLHLHETVLTLSDDIGDCIDLDMLESVEPGCRPY